MATPPADISIEGRLVQVRDAIDRVKLARLYQFTVQTDRTPNAAEVNEAILRVARAKAQVGEQWENIDLVLQHAATEAAGTLVVPGEQIAIQRTGNNQYTVRSGDRYEDYLTFDEVLGAVATWLIAPDRRPAFLRTAEEHARDGKHLGEQPDGTFAVAVGDAPAEGK